LFGKINFKNKTDFSIKEPHLIGKWAEGCGVILLIPHEEVIE